MRNFYTSVVEFRQPFTREVFTHPYETGWAREAIFFVTVEDCDCETIDLSVQIGPDGIRWMNEGNGIEQIAAPGEYFVRVAHFGGWLRLAGVISGGAETAQLTVRLALKE